MRFDFCTQVAALFALTAALGTNTAYGRDEEGPPQPENVIGYTERGAEIASGGDPFPFYAASKSYQMSQVLLGAAPTALDLRADWRAIYDEENLYVHVVVDDEFSVGSDSYLWEGDSIEIYVDPDYSRGAEYDGVNDYQLVVAGGDRLAVGVNSIPSTEGVRAVSYRRSRIGPAFIVRVAIPWSTLEVTPTPGMSIGLDVHINDRDDRTPGAGREGKLGTFAAVDDAWTRPASFGSFVLGPRGPLPEEIPNTANAAWRLTVDGLAETPGDGPLWNYAPLNPIEHLLHGPQPAQSELSGSFRALWDAQALYVFVTVTDDEIVRDSPYPWEDDSVEVYVDASGAGRNWYSPETAQVVFRPFDAQVYVGTATASDPSGVSFATRATATGYTLEAAIPWTMLGTSASLGQPIGIDVHLNDDQDGGARECKLAGFADVDEAWRDPSRFAKAVLAPPANVFPLVALL